MPSLDVIERRAGGSRAETKFSALGGAGSISMSLNVHALEKKTCLKALDACWPREGRGRSSVPDDHSLDG